METIQIAYRILFELRIEIEGADIDSNQFIRVMPDAETLSPLKGYRILSKQQKNANVFLIETVPVGPDEEAPKYELEPDEVFRFHIKFKDQKKFEGTHLSTYDWANDVLVVSNEVSHVVASELLLSKTWPVYNATNDYLPGFVVTSGGNAFKALQPSNNADQHPTSETDYWKPVTNATAIGQADLFPRSALTFPTDLDTIIVLEVKHAATVPANYQLLDTNEKCREVTYHIKILKQN